LTGGVLVIVGMVLMVINVWKTLQASRGAVEHPVLEPAHA
jgi:cbb3-type cytochrome oxidase subunit 1